MVFLHKQVDINIKYTSAMYSFYLQNRNLGKDKLFFISYIPISMHICIDMQVLECITADMSLEGKIRKLCPLILAMSCGGIPGKSNYALKS